jgi:hypothetical protein
LSEFVDALAGHDRVSCKMLLEAKIVNLRYALGGHDRATLEEYLEMVDLKVIDREGGATACETLFIG